MRAIHLHIYVPPESDAIERFAADLLPDCDSGETCGVEPMKATVFPRLIRDRLRVRLIDAAEATGADRTDVNRVVAELEQERPLLDWLLSGGWEKLLALVLELLRLAA